MDKRKFRCFDCNHVWEVEFGIPRPLECPKCEGSNFHREDSGGQRTHRRRGREKIRHIGRKHLEGQD